MEHSKRFYSEALGWTFTDYGESYSGIQSSDGSDEMGGITTQGTPSPQGGPLVVLLSSDLEASLDAVKKAGGTISTEIFEFPGGKRFHFMDPSGYEIAIWTKL
jgi:predicted enzyme related to lactoylglutathione lyase